MLLPLAALLFWATLPHAGRCVPLPLQDEDLLADAVEYTEKNPETLVGLVDEDVMEGDMLVSYDRNAVDRRWPSTRIPYTIDYTLRYRSDDIKTALNMISRHTCLVFQQRTNEPDYIFFKVAVGCASYVGFMGGQQELHVGITCTVGNIVHEVLHALGFYHEHTRMDRDKYITIVPDNIMRGHQKNFFIQRGETFQLPYDLPSIMHYGSTFFSSNGEPTIVAKVRNNNMGQRFAMTPTDIQRIRLHYKCDQVREVAKLYWWEPEVTPAPVYNVHVFDIKGLPHNTTQSPLGGARNDSSADSGV
ncbi:blastula protease 10 [Hippocampus comes]|uniref:Metalloendopeptidase n=1 Tax=Hippocampus comes TaxID=109280 RepID=A0A3Q3DNM0_HIPCM|nr:PREDICTED: blastula protease 10-like [Hippocampus comes]